MGYKSSVLPPSCSTIMASIASHPVNTTPPSRRQVRLSSINTTTAMDGYYTYDHSPQPASPPSPFRPGKPEDWEPYHDIIAHLYNTLNLKLKDVMAEMEQTYSFKAT